VVPARVIEAVPTGEANLNSSDRSHAAAGRTDAVNAMLLNEFLKEHRKVQEQEATITQLKKNFRTTVAQLTARLDEQAAQIEKVSAQLETSKPAPQVANNP